MPLARPPGSFPLAGAGRTTTPRKSNSQVRQVFCAVPPNNKKRAGSLSPHGHHCHRRWERKGSCCAAHLASPTEQQHASRRARPVHCRGAVAGECTPCIRGGAARASGSGVRAGGGRIKVDAAEVAQEQGDHQDHAGHEAEPKTEEAPAAVEGDVETDRKKNSSS